MSEPPRTGRPSAPVGASALTRLLIVDDHAIVRAGVHRLLASDPSIHCLEADSSEAAIEVLQREPVDLALFDLNLPGLGGPEAIGALLKIRPELRVLVFSTHAEPIYVSKALEAGALGYVSKNAAPEELIEAIRSVLRGCIYVEAEIAQEMADRGVDGALKALTSREFEILRLLARGQSLTGIAAALGVAYKTVANTCTHIKEKLGARQTSDLVRMAIEHKVI
jgi:two-component system invasion response regulator UvrY